MSAIDSHHVIVASIIATEQSRFEGTEEVREKGHIVLPVDRGERRHTFTNEDKGPNCDPTRKSQIITRLVFWHVQYAESQRQTNIPSNPQVGRYRQDKKHPQKQTRQTDIKHPAVTNQTKTENENAKKKLVAPL
jgi:hypothetical protein